MKESGNNVSSTVKELIFLPMEMYIQVNIKMESLMERASTLGKMNPFI